MGVRYLSHFFVNSFSRGKGRPRSPYSILVYFLWNSNLFVLVIEIRSTFGECFLRLGKIGKWEVLLDEYFFPIFFFPRAS